VNEYGPIAAHTGCTIAGLPRFLTALCAKISLCSLFNYSGPSLFTVFQESTIKTVFNLTWREFESEEQARQMAAGQKSPKLKSSLRPVSTTASAIPDGAAVAARRSCALLRVLTGLRRKAVSILLVRDFKALDAERSKHGGSAAWPRHRPLLQAVVLSTWELGSIQHAEYKGSVKREMDDLVKALGDPRVDDTTETKYSRTMREWRYIHKALLPGSPFMQSVAQAETENRHASSDCISVGEYLDFFYRAKQGFGRDAMYVINNVLLVPPKRGLDKKRHRLQKQVQNGLRQLQEMEPEDGLCFALLVAPTTGAPTLVRADGVHVVAAEPELSEVDSARTLVPGANSLA
jgi:hypothetical protein